MKELSNKKIAVIGAGPAGLTAAYSLCKYGYDVNVFEAGEQVGGMCRTLRLWDCFVDVGPHRFFSFDKRVNELWLEIAQDDYTMVNRLTRIYYKNKLFHYPLQPLDALRTLGISDSTTCMVSYLGEKISPTEPKGDFESWVKSRFGRKLYQIFFKTYSEKLWGIPCTDIDADFAAQRIKKLSLWEAIKNGIRPSGQHKTLVDEFAYPVEGTGMIYSRMAKRISQLGGKIYLKTPVSKVVVNDNRTTGILFQDGNYLEYDEIISTMPLTQLVRNLDNCPAGVINNSTKLRFRNTTIVYLQVAGTDLFPDNWLYIHASELLTGRITNFRNWVPTLYNDHSFTILAMEYWSNNEDDFWHYSDDTLSALAKEEIRKTGLIGEARILDSKVVRVPNCYPIYSKGYKQLLDPIQDYLDSIEGLHCIGRYGSFKYNNQDHSILMGLLAAENIAEGKQNNLWGVNTDYDTYQEETVITKTGLRKKTVQV